MNLLPKSISHRVTAQYNIQDIKTIIKELLENSLDSGADSIEIKIQEYGKSGIIISDNGCGIRSSDFDSLAHEGCTSKLVNENEMNSIETLGFRGMALFSISRMASLVIDTKHAEDSHGWSLGIEDGVVVSKGESNINRGTRVTVSNIFHSNPIRLQDLMNKKDFYLRKISELVQSYSVFYYAKRISFEHQLNNKKNLLVPVSVASSLYFKLRGILGQETIAKFQSFAEDKNSFKIEMIMSNPSLDLNKKLNLFFINGRLVETPKIIAGIMDNTFIDFKKGWSYVIFLYVNNGIDVNVSIDKMMVLFEYEAELVEFLSEFFKHVLDKWLDEVSMKKFVPNFESVKKPVLSVDEGKKEVNVLPLNFAKLKEKDEGSLIGIKNEIINRGLDQVISIHVIGENDGDKMMIENDKCKIEDDKDVKDFKDDKDIENCLQVMKVPASKTPMSLGLNKGEIDLDNKNCRLDWKIEDVKVQAIGNGNGNKGRNLGTCSLGVSLDKDVSLSFHKSDFLKLIVHGQFNKGFIIAEKDTKLFIIDQHAADEKFLFETLQKSTEIHTQPLLIPKKLQISPYDELLLLQHISTFKSNGFNLQYHEDNPPGSRFTLNSFPVSKNIVFNQDDFFQCFEKLKTCFDVVSSKDLPNLIRCKKFRDMFASRACRKAVMIGTDLNHAKMKEIVRNLNGLEQPWNCPHGRPTIKLLSDLPVRQVLPKPKYDKLK